MKRGNSGSFAALGSAFFGAVIAWQVSAQQSTDVENPHAEILSIGGEITEIVYALDQGHRLIARDTTSTWPEQARDLPDVGYMRALSPEGVLSVGASMILSAEGSGPQEAIDVIKQADINFIEVAHGFDGDAIAEKIRTVGAALEVEDKAEALARDVTAALDSAEAAAEAYQGPRKKVMFILSANGGKLTAGGQNTAADALIRMAGGVNAAQGFDGYKPVSGEAVLAAAPDVILMMNRGGDHAIPAQKLFSMPALALTPAARNGALIHVDGLKALRFGPRTAEAVTELTQALYGE
ncbi:MAG: ABC transporter substrate-binding protein [Pelagimonas sp.]|jgi:iron complex transport system substrate-binding protein|nr:ABC transporter substrate-binding protein [Pelagimonas sp.]